MSSHEDEASQHEAMTAAQFRSWRRKLGWNQIVAADHLGLKKRIIQYYEKGRRDGKPVVIPKTVRLACYALANGIRDFDGESAQRDQPGEAK